MVGADSIQEKQRYLQYTIQSMKFFNSFTACFQSNFILSGTSFLSPEIDSKLLWYLLAYWAKKYIIETNVAFLELVTHRGETTPIKRDLGTS